MIIMIMIIVIVIVKVQFCFFCSIHFYVLLLPRLGLVILFHLIYKTRLCSTTL